MADFTSIIKVVFIIIIHYIQCNKDSNFILTGALLLMSRHFKINAVTILITAPQSFLSCNITAEQMKLLDRKKITVRGVKPKTRL